MVDIDVFLSRLLPSVPACSEPLARLHLMDSAINFCTKSCVLKEVLTDITTVAGTDSYTLTLPSTEHELVRVLSVTVDDIPIQAVFSEDVPRVRSSDGSPSQFYTTRQDSQLQLVLNPVPDGEYTISVTVALKPSRSANTVDDDLYEYWVDSIVDGALATIAKIPNQPFTDYALSSVAQASANDGAMKAKAESYYGRVRGSTRVRLRPLM